MECDIRVEGFNDMQAGATIDWFTTEKAAPKTWHSLTVGRDSVEP